MTQSGFALSNENVPENLSKRPVSQLKPRCLMRKLIEACWPFVSIA